MCVSSTVHRLEKSADRKQIAVLVFHLDAYPVIPNGIPTPGLHCTANVPFRPLFTVIRQHATVQQLSLNYWVKHDIQYGIMITDPNRVSGTWTSTIKENNNWITYKYFLFVIDFWQINANKLTFEYMKRNLILQFSVFTWRMYYTTFLPKVRPARFLVQKQKTIFSRWNIGQYCVGTH